MEFCGAVVNEGLIRNLDSLKWEPRNPETQVQARQVPQEICHLSHSHVKVYVRRHSRL